MTRKMFFAAAVALAAGLLAPAAGQAAFSITFTSGATTQTITDGGAFDTDTDVGEISFSLTSFAGGLDISGSANRSPLAGGPTVFGNPAAQLTSSTTTIRNLAATPTSLQIAVSEDAFTYGGPGAAVQVNTGVSTSSLSGTAQSTSLINATQVGQSGMIMGPTGAGSSSVNSSTTLPLIPFTFTNRLDLTNLGVGAQNTLTSTSTLFNAQIPAVPVPATAIMLLATAPVLGLARRLRRSGN